MSHLWPSRVRETVTTTGTGSYTLAGAVTGYRTFASVMSNGDTVDACIRFGANWEIGRYTFNAGVLARTAILASSNAGAAVNWVAGTKDIFAIHIGFSDLDATGLANLALLVGALGTTGTPAAGEFPRFTAAAQVEALAAGAFRTAAGLAIGSDVQAYSGKLAALAALTWASGKILRLTGTLAANSDDRAATQKAVKTYVDGIVAATDAMVFKGVVDCSADPNYPAADRGHTYRVSVAGKIGGASGINVEAGDILLCLTDGTAAGNHATVGSAWNIVQANIDGAVIGPNGVTDNNPVVFDGTTGRLVKQRTWSQFRALADLEPGTDFAEIPSSANLPIGFCGLMRYTGASSLANGSTTSGSNVRTIAFTGDFGSLGLNIASGSAQSGTWRNVNGTALERISSDNDGEQIGYMVRIS